MIQRPEDDSSSDAKHESEAKEDEAVVAEAGEGPFPPIAGEPRPPIGN
ncbi:hypothetical protein [Mycobacterium asiaticum]|nr:hypothetical protein [Mycobacterium asiaticum]